MDQSNYIANQQKVLDFAVLFTTLRKQYCFFLAKFRYFSTNKFGKFWIIIIISVNSTKFSF
jgi:hypothetical protein